MVMIECPRLLFPFAREIVAAATRNGGFPPLMLEPVDFASLYRDRMAAAQQANKPANPG
jgi:preprotein translocase subunit SecB